MVKDEPKKIRFEEEPIEVGSSYAATCNRNCYMDPSILSAEYAFRFFDMEKEIEEAKKIDDFAGEREAISMRIKRDLEDEKASLVTDFLKKFPEEDRFNHMLPEKCTPVMKTVKPKTSKFQIFEDNEVPDFVPIPKKNKRAFALRRL